LPGDVPDLGHGVLAGLGHPAGAPQESGQADDQSDGVGAQDVDVVLELVADGRELGQGGVQHALLKRGMAGEQEAEHRDEDEQQWEPGEKAVPGKQRGEVVAVVVAELLDDPEGEPEPTVGLLVSGRRAAALAPPDSRRSRLLQPVRLAGRP
jgi:hypothetical protein